MKRRYYFRRDKNAVIVTVADGRSRRRLVPQGMSRFTTEAYGAKEFALELLQDLFGPKNLAVTLQLHEVFAEYFVLDELCTELDDEWDMLHDGDPDGIGFEPLDMLDRVLEIFVQTVLECLRPDEAADAGAGLLGKYLMAKGGA